MCKLHVKYGHFRTASHRKDSNGNQIVELKFETQVVKFTIKKKD